MVDFAQEGMITTIHDLKQRHLHEYEQELREFTKSKPVTLILPSLYSELEHPALTQIVEELKGADYIQQIIIGLDQPMRSSLPMRGNSSRYCRKPCNFME